MSPVNPVIALEGLQLTDKGRAELGATPPAPFTWCMSLWGDDTVHQCILAPRHEGGCVCACGANRNEP